MYTENKNKTRINQAAHRKSSEKENKPIDIDAAMESIQIIDVNEKFSIIKHAKGNTQQ